MTPPKNPNQLNHEEVNMENEIQNASVPQEESSAPVSAEQPQTETQTEPQAAPAEAVRPRPEPVPVTDEMLDNSKTSLITMLDYLGLDGTVKAEGRPGKINLLIASSDAGRIIGRNGQSLESLQVLVNRMMQKGDEPCPKIYIDIDGYSSNSKRGERREREGGERRPFRNGPAGRRPHRNNFEDRGDDDSRSKFDAGKDEQLRQQALDSAKEVRRWGEPVTLPQMNSHDRRIIHITLEKEADLVTESVGDGNFKSVVISLKKEN